MRCYISISDGFVYFVSAILNVMYIRFCDLDYIFFGFVLVLHYVYCVCAMYSVLPPVCGLYLGQIYGSPGCPYLSLPSQYKFQILL